MSKTKKRKITEAEQRVAADILTQFGFAINLQQMNHVWDSVFKQYDLHRDPFTGMPCSGQEYAEATQEYERQAMIERYGHCDGI